MIQRLLSAAFPDVLKMADDAIAAARFGRGVKLTWQSGCGWSGADVERLLNGYGIRCYSRQYADGEGGDFGCHVRAEQARWAERVCRQAGVPLTGALIDESNRNVQAGAGMPTAWGVPVKAVGLAGLFVGSQSGTQRRTKRQRRGRR